VSFDWDWAGAEKLYQRAIQLDSWVLPLLDFYALYWRPWAPPQESLFEIKLAQSQDPLSPHHQCKRGMVLYLARDL